MVEAAHFRAQLAGLSSPGSDRDEDRPRAVGVAVEDARRLVAGEARHADVEHHDVGLEAVRSLDRLAAVVGRVHGVALFLEQHREAIGPVAIVVRDQHALGALAERERLIAAPIGILGGLAHRWKRASRIYAAAGSDTSATCGSFGEGL